MWSRFSSALTASKPTLSCSSALSLTSFASCPPTLRCLAMRSARLRCTAVLGRGVLVRPWMKGARRPACPMGRPRRTSACAPAGLVVSTVPPARARRSWSRHVRPKSACSRPTCAPDPAARARLGSRGAGASFSDEGEGRLCGPTSVEIPAPGAHSRIDRSPPASLPAWLTPTRTSALLRSPARKRTIDLC